MLDAMSADPSVDSPAPAHYSGWEPTMDAQIASLQTAVVTAVAKATPRSWERIIASYEVDDHAGGRVENLVVVYITNENGELTAAGLEGAPNTIELAFFALRQASDGDRWSMSELTIDPYGTYKFSFSFDAPKRINGVFDEQSLDKFDNYAAIYAAETAGAAAGLIGPDGANRR